MTSFTALLGFGPHAGAHRVAARAGVSVLVPLVTLWATDHLAWSAYAVFGAFAALYGRMRTAGARMRMQVEAGVLLTGVVGLGVAVGTSDERAWLAVPVAAAVAAGVALLSDRRGWHPPGALFPVFALTACASLPASWGEVVTAVLVAGAAAGFAVLVGVAGTVVRSSLRAVLTPPAGPTLRPAAGDLAFSLRSHAVPSAVAVLAAGVLATGAGIGHPYWAMVSAVVPLVARTAADQLVRGAHRVLGTMVGLVLAAGLFALDLQGLVLVLVVVALQVVAELLVGRNYAAALVAITPLALLMVHLAAPVPPRDLLVDRAVETLIGVAVGLAVGTLFRPRRTAGG